MAFHSQSICPPIQPGTNRWGSQWQVKLPKHAHVPKYSQLASNTMCSPHTLAKKKTKSTVPCGQFSAWSEACGSYCHKPHRWLPVGRHHVQDKWHCLGMLLFCRHSEERRMSKEQHAPPMDTACTLCVVNTFWHVNMHFLLYVLALITSASSEHFLTANVSSWAEDQWTVHDWFVHKSMTPRGFLFCHSSKAVCIGD